MRKVSLDVYTFEELPEKAQENLIDIQTELNSLDWDDYFSEDVINDWVEVLKAKGFNGAVINYSGFYSQGDGASFTCGYIDLNKLSEVLGLITDSKKKRYAVIFEHLIEEASVKRVLSSYYHEHTTSLVLRNRLDHYGHSRAQRALQDFIDDNYDVIKSYIVDLNIEIYQDLRDDHESHTSEKYARELLIEKGCHYLYINNRTIEISDYMIDEK
jgi:hypothetical protein